MVSMPTAAAVKRGRVRGVLGGEGDLARGDSDRDGGDRDRVSS